MPKTSKNMKAPAPRKGSKATAAVKPLLVRHYKINDPRTLRERERDENVNRCLKGLGNWERGRGFCAWDSRNKSLKETKRSDSYLFSKKVNFAGLDNRQQQFMEDTRGCRR